MHKNESKESFSGENKYACKSIIAWYNVLCRDTNLDVSF